MDRTAWSLLVLLILAGGTPASAQQTSKTYTDSRGKTIAFPLGDSSFADEVVAFEVGTPPSTSRSSRSTPRFSSTSTAPSSGPRRRRIWPRRRLASPPTRMVTVEGHTDNVGADADNQRLSQARATAVRTFLLSRPEMRGREIAVEGRGAGQPVTPNITEDGRQKNRRVEIVIVPRP